MQQTLNVFNKSFCHFQAIDINKTMFYTRLTLNAVEMILKILSLKPTKKPGKTQIQQRNHTTRYAQIALNSR